MAYRLVYSLTFNSWMSATIVCKKTTLKLNFSYFVAKWKIKYLFYSNLCPKALCFTFNRAFKSGLRVESWEVSTANSVSIKHSGENVSTFIVAVVLPKLWIIINEQKMCPVLFRVMNGKPYTCCLRYSLRHYDKKWIAQYVFHVTLKKSIPRASSTLYNQ